LARMHANQPKRVRSHPAISCSHAPFSGPAHLTGVSQAPSAPRELLQLSQVTMLRGGGGQHPQRAARCHRRATTSAWWYEVPYRRRYVVRLRLTVATLLVLPTPCFVCTCICPRRAGPRSTPFQKQGTLCWLCSLCLVPGDRPSHEDGRFRVSAGWLRRHFTTYHQSATGVSHPTHAPSPSGRFLCCCWPSWKKDPLGPGDASKTAATLQSLAG